MIERYTRPEMGRIWSTDNRFRCWLRVEVAVAEAWAVHGRVPEEVLPTIRSATVDPERILEIEAETQHDVIAFLRNLDERIGPDARFIHLGLTSSDVVDTALALQLVESSDVLLADVEAVLAALRQNARRYQNTVMIGRTHNVHAEPITFGFKLAVWYAEMERHRERLRHVREEVATAKISGAVGTHANVSADIEERVAAQLGLRPEPVSTQVVQRDRHAAYILALALLASSLDKMATELRNLQHTEIFEVEEPFGRGQQGSSAMPHKRNPILNERISGLARVIRGYAVPALEDVVLWHERDISNSSAERVILPDASILTDYILGVFATILSGMRVNADRMQENMDRSRGLFFSEKVLTALIETGLTRPRSYEIVQGAALRALDSGRSLQETLTDDVEVRERLSTDTLDAIFDVDGFLHSIHIAFERLGLSDGDETEGAPAVDPSVVNRL